MSAAGMTVLEGVISRVVRVLMTLNEETQVDLAEVLGIKPQAVSDKMNGRIRWNIDDIERMARHYEVRSADFMRDPKELILRRRTAAA
jgi:antitoxin component HigA of HigAB toxin-antitoxin module